MNETPDTPPPAVRAAPATRQGFLGELWDAAAPGRTFALVVAVLLIQLGFVFSYVGAFHDRTPHGVPIALIASAALRTSSKQSYVIFRKSLRQSPDARARIRA